MERKETYWLIIRYALLIFLGAFDLGIFYFIFTPATIYPSLSLLSLFDTNANLLEGNVLFFKGTYIEIIPACVAGAAYYLLMILNLSTPMKIKKRLMSICFLLLSFIVLNIIRICAFSFLFVVGFSAFDFAHKFFWYFGSTVLVVLAWFANVRLFNIRSIPIYSDVKNILEDVNKKNKKPKR